ncbi:hypothetical protein CYMTET_56955 [Cymbomonas tetramitiformis]|uniref:Secreted protein n=1 Tax=Cymbomonas tetramitiformis TaxID=36881 RepID=A0AAE0BBN8_9CHLO|nr:hypothetical protein CYMTET_56955 [Cymbomonas tetramitiformis]|eukprot:gene23548-28515_t
MSFLRVVLAGALFGIAIATTTDSSCGPEQPSKVKDCEHSDLGSCGNACCTVSQVSTKNPTAVYDTIKKYLEQNGGDGFSYVTGPDDAGHNPSDDLRKYNITWKYTMQGQHTTSGGYTDTLNFNVFDSGNGLTGIRAFSVSNIHGALGDNGQNYKTLAYMLRGMFGELQIVYGCGEQTPAEEEKAEDDIVR